MFRFSFDCFDKLNFRQSYFISRGFSNIGFIYNQFFNTTPPRLFIFMLLNMHHSRAQDMLPLTEGDGH